MHSLETIVVAVDFSALSWRALTEAIELAKRDSSRLHIVHAVERPLIPAAHSFEIPTAYVDDPREVARELLEEAVKSAAQHGVDAEGHLCGSPTATSIDEMAAKHDADLLVVGTHGHTGFKHFALGSVAERVLRGAPCNVLVVKAPQGETDEPATEPNG